MACSNAECSCIYDAIERNMGKIVTVFTASGGASGSGFTGLLTNLEGDAIRLVTSLPDAPPYPFPGCRCGSGSTLCGSYRNGRNNPFGSSTLIPVSQIVSFIAAEV